MFSISTAKFLRFETRSRTLLAGPAVVHSTMVSRREEREQERLAEARRRMIQKQGVLVPPAFAGISSPLSLSTLDRLPPHPSLYETMLQQSPSQRVLLDHMEPGVWASAYSPSIGRVRASLSPNNGGGTLQADRSIGDHVSILLRSGTSGTTQLLSSYRPLPSLTLFGSMNNTGTGWLGGAVDTSLPLPDIEEKAAVSLGAWVPLSTKYRSAKDVELVHGYAQASCLGASLSTESRLRLSTLELQNRFLFSMDIQDSSDPLHLSLEQSGSTSAIALTQTMSFDRYQLNPLEDRAPFVRNTAAISIRMERKNNENQVIVGGAWELNRNIALKAVLRHSQLTTAVLVKRWKHPSVTCSILNRFDGKSASFLGVGLELDTSKEGHPDPASLYPKSPGAPNHTVPETKATLG